MDFGLASSPELDLDADERRFLAAHRHYDVGELLYSLSLVLTRAYLALGDDEQARARRCCGVSDPTDRRQVLAGLVGGAASLVDEGLVDLHPRFVAALGRYRDVILYVGEVLESVLGDPHRPYDDAELVARLVSCGVAPTA